MEKGERGQRHEQRPEQEVEVDFLERTPDEARLIADYLQLKVRRQNGFEFLQALLHAINHLYRVAAGLLAHDDCHALLSVRGGERARFFDAILDPGDVLQEHRLPAEIRHDEFVEILHRFHATEGTDGELAGVLVEPAAGNFNILPVQRLAQVVNRQAVGAELFNVHGHLHRAGARSGQADRADIRHGLEALLDELVRDVTDLLQVARRGDTDRDDGDGVEVELVNDRRVGVRWQTGENGIHLVAHVLRREVAIAFQQKLDGDLRNALGCDAAQFINALNRVDDFLQGFGDAGFHFLG